MKKPRVLVLTGYGINCDYETEFAFNHPSVGAEARRVHLNDLIDGHDSLENYQILALPGGFSYGDDIAAGKVLASKITHRLSRDFERFIGAGKLIIGICNGFQTMAKMRILAGTRGNGAQDVTLTNNDSGRFEDRWVYLKVNPDSPCVFTKGIDMLYLPVRHGEGKFVPADEETCKLLHERNQIVVRYSDADGNVDGEYPLNPNGSVDDVAGICDRSGRIFGLMPHPEGYLSRYNHPRWTREELPQEGMGLQVFRNAAQFAAKKLL